MLSYFDKNLSTIRALPFYVQDITLFIYNISVLAWTKGKT